LYIIWRTKYIWNNFRLANIVFRAIVSNLFGIRWNIIWRILIIFLKILIVKLKFIIHENFILLCLFNFLIFNKFILINNLFLQLIFIFNRNWKHYFKYICMNIFENWRIFIFKFFYSQNIFFAFLIFKRIDLNFILSWTIFKF
jgi:hypothetical protein